MSPEMRQQSAAMLRDVRALIDVPEKWIKYQMHSYRDGHACRCLLGAMTSVRSPATLVYQETEDALKALSYKRSGISQLGAFNDEPSTTHADVLALLDQAIAEMTS